MRDLGYVANEISKDKNLDVNLKKYGAGMSDLYNSLAYIKLSMNYYTIYDMQRDNFCIEPQYIDKCTRVHELAGRLVSGDELKTESIETLRNEIMNVVEVIMAYADHFRIYEYILNRLEYKFKTVDFDEEYYNSKMSDELMRYILSDRDNVVIHNRISEVIEQLPMRLSRPKFYDYLRDTFTVYKGSQKGTIDDFVYTLKTTAMLIKPEGFDDLFDELSDIEKTLAAADYAAIDEAEFNRLFDLIHIAAEKVSALADAFVMLAEVVNDIYTASVMLETGAVMSDEAVMAADVIRKVYEAYKESADIPEDVLEQFEQLEGKQEHILMVISKCDFAVDMINSLHNEKVKQMGLEGVYRALEIAAKLQSGSNFVKLESDAQLLEEASDEYINQACDSLIDEMDKSFKNSSQQVRRAVMAAVFAQLPVFFNNATEIQSYINVSIMQCSDMAEKAAVVEIIKDIIAVNDMFNGLDDY